MTAFLIGHEQCDGCGTEYHKKHDACPRCCE